MFEILERAKQQRLPVAGSLELTHRCNLRCVHCYLGDQAEIRRHRQAELSTAAFKGLIDQLAAAGTLLLTLTGGEPLMRSDFQEIYRYAVERGMLITLFTDGVLVDEPLIALLRRYPPRAVEVSLYGATAETYERITQIHGAFAACRRGIELLLGAGIRVVLKSVLLTENRHEVDALRQLAAGYGVEFRLDGAISPCLPNWDNGGRANSDVAADPSSGVGLEGPLRFRVEPAAVAGFDFADAKERALWERATKLIPEIRPEPRLFGCGAGRWAFHLDPYGFLHPCLVTTGLRYDLGELSFADGWARMVEEIDRLEAGAAFRCGDCAHRFACPGCPAVFALETGSMDRPSEYLCRITQARFEHLAEWQRDKAGRINPANGEPAT